MASNCSKRVRRTFKLVVVQRLLPERAKVYCQAVKERQTFPGERNPRQRRWEPFKLDVKLEGEGIHHRLDCGCLGTDELDTKDVFDQEQRTMPRERLTGLERVAYRKIMIWLVEECRGCMS